MRLTDTCDIAFRVLIFAAAKGEQWFRIEDVVNFYSVSRSTTMKVVNTLTRSGMLEARRGRSGGLRLGMPTGEIALADVVRLIEPDFALVECQRPDNACRITPICALPAPLIAATQAFLDTLGQYTLEDIAIDGQRMFPAPG
ncbi:RrF2 family transcriptional regulator [Sulfitobacter aestuarii]|uniref:RrF2 family transcriptional regulator n=1 Tax=Sulfitobacter aestuarii TaxID=2161676 RepID=A0ABW5U0H7_9RHOB